MVIPQLSLSKTCSFSTKKINKYTVALARVLFPMEARVAMDIAQVDGTLEFSLGTSANHRSTVDLNETPFKIKEEHLIRMKALSRTGIYIPCVVNLHCM